MLKKHLEIGKYAVFQAMRMCKTIQNELTGGESITKSDKSPVTIADFASQAIVCKILNEHFPSVPIVGEEHSAALTKPENKEILAKTLHYISQDAATALLINQDNLFHCIDLGSSEPTSGLFWTLDPIDGTKGFLRGEQFAVALSLIRDGEVQLGILGCPNLEIPNSQSRNGYLLFAIKGEGTHLLNIETGLETTTHISSITDPRKMRFVESYVSSHSNLDMQLAIARDLKMEQEPVRMDSQVKYAVIASGHAEIYARIPHPDTPNYEEKIWDHAAGSIVVQESGGIVSDMFGKPLDFSVGKTLKENTGVIASTPVIHEQVISIIHKLSQ